MNINLNFIEIKALYEAFDSFLKKYPDLDIDRRFVVSMRVKEKGDNYITHRVKIHDIDYFDK